MRRHAIGILALVALAGCGGSGLDGSWKKNLSNTVIIFRSGDSVTVNEGSGADYSGTWKVVGSNNVELDFGGMLGKSVCEFNFPSGKMTLSGCPWEGWYTKR